MNSLIVAMHLGFLQPYSNGQHHKWILGPAETKPSTLCFLSGKFHMWPTICLCYRPEIKNFRGKQELQTRILVFICASLSVSLLTKLPILFTDMKHFYMKRESERKCEIDKLQKWNLQKSKMNGTGSEGKLFKEWLSFFIRHWMQQNGVCLGGDRMLRRKIYSK